MHTPYFSMNLCIANARLCFATADGVVSARITASTSHLFCQLLPVGGEELLPLARSPGSSLLGVRIAAASSYKITS